MTVTRWYEPVAPKASAAHGLWWLGTSARGMALRKQKMSTVPEWGQLQLQKSLPGGTDGVLSRHSAAFEIGEGVPHSASPSSWMMNRRQFWIKKG